MSFCIFCGAAPSEKTQEHVMPQWLLRLTGDPNRSAYFGRDWLSPDLKQRIYSWSSFTFPACDACNERWSHIEGEVKGIVERMLTSQPLAAQDFYVFLDWIDKVRTGLWLGMIYLNKNCRGIIPQFHIDDRVGQKDTVACRGTDNPRRNVHAPCRQGCQPQAHAIRIHRD
jgi:hypothetical protein